MPLALFAAALIAHQDGYPPVQANRWAYQALALAQREGMVTPYPNNRWNRRPVSRYEFVVALHASATFQLQKAEAFVKAPGSDSDRALLIRSAVLLLYYARAEREFKKEFVSLGVEDDFGQSRLSALSRQIEANAPARSRLFRDVPAAHWAAKAVGDLRALGLLDGYPDTSYRG